MRPTVFLFGEAEKGDFCTPYLCKSLPQLADTFGNPPEESLGLAYAVQTLLYERELIYFRVQEEGFSRQDYMKGIKLLQNKEIPLALSAIYLPGVGDVEILDAGSSICHIYKTFLVINQKDLYDYLTATITPPGK